MVRILELSAPSSQFSGPIISSRIKRGSFLYPLGRRKEGDWHHCPITLPPKGETLPQTLFRLWEHTGRGVRVGPSDFFELLSDCPTFLVCPTFGFCLTFRPTLIYLSEKVGRPVFSFISFLVLEYSMVLEYSLMSGRRILISSS